MLDASAVNRRTKQSPSWTMPLGSGVTPTVPVVWSHEVTLALKYGVAPSGLPMIEIMRPTGVHDGFEDGGAPFRYPVTSVPADTLSIDPPITPPWIRCLAFSPTLLTYGDGRAHVERTKGPANVIDPGV